MRASSAPGVFDSRSRCWPVPRGTHVDPLSTRWIDSAPATGGRPGCLCSMTDQAGIEGASHRHLPGLAPRARSLLSGPGIPMNLFMKAANLAAAPCLGLLFVAACSSDPSSNEPQGGACNVGSCASDGTEAGSSEDTGGGSGGSSGGATSRGGSGNGSGSGSSSGSAGSGSSGSGSSGSGSGSGSGGSESSSGGASDADLSYDAIGNADVVWGQPCLYKLRQAAARSRTPRSAAITRASS